MMKLLSASVFDKIPRGWFSVWEWPGVETRPSVIVEMTVNKSLLRLLLYYWEELFISEEQGAFIKRASGSPSKFSFLWCALFLVCTHKQSPGCRHWISRLCHRVAPGSGQLSCAASAYISMWKAKAVPNIPCKHLSCPKTLHGKSPGSGRGTRRVWTFNNILCWEACEKMMKYMFFILFWFYFWFRKKKTFPEYFGCLHYISNLIIFRLVQTTFCMSFSHRVIISEVQSVRNVAGRQAGRHQESVFTLEVPGNEFPDTSLICLISL